MIDRHLYWNLDCHFLDLSGALLDRVLSNCQCGGGNTYGSSVYPLKPIWAADLTSCVQWFWAVSCDEFQGCIRQKKRPTDVVTNESSCVVIEIRNYQERLYETALLGWEAAGQQLDVWAKEWWAKSMVDVYGDYKYTEICFCVSDRYRQRVH